MDKPQRAKIFRPKKFTAAKKFARHRENKSEAQGYKRLYDSMDWRKYRFRFLHHNPNCYACFAPAEHIDHIKPHKGDLALFWNETNYVGLCKSCHSYVTATFDRGATPKTPEKLEWFSNTRKSRNLTHKVKVVPLRKK